MGPDEDEVAAPVHGQTAHSRDRSFRGAGHPEIPADGCAVGSEDTGVDTAVRGSWTAQAGEAERHHGEPARRERDRRRNRCGQRGRRGQRGALSHGAAGGVELLRVDLIEAAGCGSGIDGMDAPVWSGATRASRTGVSGTSLVSTRSRTGPSAPRSARRLSPSPGWTPRPARRYPTR